MEVDSRNSDPKTSHESKSTIQKRSLQVAAPYHSHKVTARLEEPDEIYLKADGTQ